MERLGNAMRWCSPFVIRRCVGSRRLPCGCVVGVYELFNGKAGCIACHNGPLASDQKYYRTGVPRSPDFDTLDIERDAPESMHAFLFFAQITFDPFATETCFPVHLEPRIVTTGGNSAARRAGT